MLEGQFLLPRTYDLIAVFLFAMTGAIVAYRKGYDYVGLFILALSVGAGGGIIRDSIFLNEVPLFITDWRYLAVILCACALVIIGRERIMRANLLFVLADGLGLGLYAVVGAQKGINAGFSVLAAALIGLINAVGGGLLRDLFSAEEPYLVQAGGQLYSLAAVLGVSTFLAVGVGAKLNAQASAFIAIGVAFAARIVFIFFDIRSSPAKEHRTRHAIKRFSPKLDLRKKRPEDGERRLPQR
ncbi:MAG: hypothetical protein A2V52_07515 [Actinobacteria bacterium RBG_19FT_COMBO_54_7]|uniref:Glycine transporter domain-containing protein n=1 Tax=Candidatus Solincola sediminis TaxID=1797199 RepID=A0A1F2WI88_9ACTN|nr:MAG: hypothetical protein A2Y75_01100 [Candidatus Solincola sediminis]OFW57200.1 MAG: hypothetical protein A2W01_00695 [Candidatus Solincola sediminis]OFW66232.1 MAG: hypothetical protein A2V52_07515 [Actinobacteria bacterium RBG_19FT_COMBO_54_7]